MTSGDDGAISELAAGFWRRFGAVIIDGIIIGLVQLLLLRLLGTTGYLLDLVFAAVYFTYCEGSSGQTPGKRVLNIRVVDVRTGGPIGYSRAFGRYLASLLSALVVYLGYLWMLWDRDHQTWHDKLAGAVVVSALDAGYRGQEQWRGSTW